jgi:hypothetical protein
VRLILSPGPFASWGARPGEADVGRPCDRYMDDPDHRLFRAVAVDAPAETLFRWLCQLRVAPYSYDWLDNRGRRSPRALTPGLERLEVGQRFMTIFKLAEFEQGRSLTLVHDGPVFGRVVVTYEAQTIGPQTSRLLVRLLVRYRGRLLAAPLSAVLPAGDLVMMRKQLLTLSACAAST